MGTGGERYKVEYSPEAWSQIGILPWEDFSSIQHALDHLARQAAESNPPSLATAPPPLDGIRTGPCPTAPCCLVRYRLDGRAHTLTLLHVLRRPPEPAGCPSPAVATGARSDAR